MPPRVGVAGGMPSEQSGMWEGPARRRGPHASVAHDLSDGGPLRGPAGHLLACVLRPAVTRDEVHHTEHAGERAFCMLPLQCYGYLSLKVKKEERVCISGCQPAVTP